MQNQSNGDALTKKTYSFVQLFDKTLEGIDYVNIPVIQRDYAQGRQDVEEIREEFIKALRDRLVLPEDKIIASVDLDFIYGYTEQNGNIKTFYPLDGQQRLTTLFLLHWYIACKDNAFEKFHNLFAKESKSKFSYQTRPSSEEFFNEFVNENLTTAATGNNPISSAIIDKKWFFLSWLHDPTIDSILRMLDKIHEIFKCEDIPFSRMVRTDKPYITFQFLDIKNSGFSDDLYIKMNARGKPLTAFETFKARLEQHIKKIAGNDTPKKLNGKPVSLSAYFSHKIDTDWADTFWRYRETSNNGTIDSGIMHFFRTLLTVFYPHILTDEKDALKKLISPEEAFSFYKYEELGCLNLDVVKSFITVLDGICDGSRGIKHHLPDSNGYYNEDETFKHVTELSVAHRTFTNEKSVQFYAYCSYLTSHSIENINGDKFLEWMRVVVNLSANTRIEIDQLRYIIHSISLLVKHADNILDFLIQYSDNVPQIDDNDNKNIFRGFDRQQLKEECLKALLIKKSDQWRKLIIDAETHGYLCGQIEFLLKFSGIWDYYTSKNNCDWTNSDDKHFIQQFSTYHQKSIAIFDESGLRSELSGPYGKNTTAIGKDGYNEFIFERALLSCGDYMLDIPHDSVKSFVENRGDYSWKRLLAGSGLKLNPASNIDQKREIFKKLLNQIDTKNISQSLVNILRSSSVNDWRKIFIDEPALIQACRHNRFIYVDDKNCPKNTIYLLERKTIYSQHFEAYSYKLMLDTLIPMRDEDKIAPFTDVGAFKTGLAEKRPFAYLTGWIPDGNALDLNIIFEKGYWHIDLTPQEESIIPDSLERLMISKLSFQKSELNDEADFSTRLIYENIPIGDIKEALLGVLEEIKNY